MERGVIAQQMKFWPATAANTHPSTSPKNMGMGARKSPSALHFQSLGAAIAAVVLLPASLSLSWLLTFGDRPFRTGDGIRTYKLAGWSYPPDAIFDNTWRTFLTDYVLSAICIYWAVRLFYSDRVNKQRGEATLFCSDSERTEHQPAASPLRYRALLLLCHYAFQAALGGVSHQLYSGSTAELNTYAFRAAWTAVVGATAAAGGCFGLIGSELLRLADTRLQLSNVAWLVYTIAMLALVASGALSCVRPACDVFIAGTSQAVPTFFLQACLLVWRRKVATLVPWKAYWVLQASLMTNAPLVFVYPFLVQRSGLPLGVVNAAMHAWLAASWAAQGWGLSVLVRVSEQVAVKQKIK